MQKTTERWSDNQFNRERNGVPSRTIGFRSDVLRGFYVRIWLAVELAAIAGELAILPRLHLKAVEDDWLDSYLLS
jgi:hypothetical protein